MKLTRFYTDIMYNLSLITNLFILTYDRNYVKGILEKKFLVVFLFIQYSEKIKSMLTCIFNS